MAPGLVGIALGRMFYTCSCDVFIGTRFPFYVKAGFFLVVFRWFYKVFGSPKASKLDFNLELCWRSSWEVSWSDVGTFLAGFWRPRWRQDGPRRRQDGLRWRQDGPRWRQDVPRWRQDVTRWRQDVPLRCRDGPRASKDEIVEKPSEK